MDVLCFEWFLQKLTLIRKRMKSSGVGVVRPSMEPRGEKVEGDGNGGIERSDGTRVWYTGSSIDVTTFNRNLVILIFLCEKRLELYLFV